MLPTKPSKRSRSSNNIAGDSTFTNIATHLRSALSNNANLSSGILHLQPYTPYTQQAIDATRTMNNCDSRLAREISHYMSQTVATAHLSESLAIDSTPILEEISPTETAITEVRAQIAELKSQMSITHEFLIVLLSQMEQYKNRLDEQEQTVQSLHRLIFSLPLSTPNTQPTREWQPSTLFSSTNDTISRQPGSKQQPINTEISTIPASSLPTRPHFPPT